MTDQRLGEIAFAIVMTNIEKMILESDFGDILRKIARNAMASGFSMREIQEFSKSLFQRATDKVLSEPDFGEPNLEDEDYQTIISS